MLCESRCEAVLTVLLEGLSHWWLSGERLPSILYEKGHTRAGTMLLGAGSELGARDQVIHFSGSHSSGVVASLNCLQRGIAPLHSACQGGFVEVVSVLLSTSPI
jgi:hypothetical protein